MDAGRCAWAIVKVKNYNKTTNSHAVVLCRYDWESQLRRFGERPRRPRVSVVIDCIACIEHILCARYVKDGTDFLFRKITFSNSVCQGFCAY